MKQQQHTAGTWTSEWDCIAEAFSLNADDDGQTHIALITAKDPETGVNYAEAAANAKLITEAPLMLSIITRIRTEQGDPAALQDDIEALLDRLGVETS